MIFRQSIGFHLFAKSHCKHNLSDYSVKFSYFFTFLFIFSWIFFSCDRDIDRPQPSEIPAFTPKSFKAVFNPLQSVPVNLYDSLPFSNTFTLKLGKPAFGTLEKGNLPGEYHYKPNHLSVMNDEVSYEVCQGKDCKSGKIDFEVSKSTCFMRIHSDQLIHSLRDTIFLSVQENDSAYCPGTHFSHFSTHVAGTQIFGHNQFAAVIPPPFFSGNLEFSYTLSNGFQQETATVKLTTAPDQFYCDKHFSLENDAFSFTLSSNTQTKTISIQDLLSNDRFCPDYIDLQGFEISIPAGQAPGFNYSRNGNHLTFFLPGGVNELIALYKIPNLTGTKTDTAKITFQSH